LAERFGKPKKSKVRKKEKGSERKLRRPPYPWAFRSVVFPVRLKVNTKAGTLLRSLFFLGSFLKREMFGPRKLPSPCPKILIRPKQRKVEARQKLGKPGTGRERKFGPRDRHKRIVQCPEATAQDRTGKYP